MYFEPIGLLEIESYERFLNKSGVEMEAFDHMMLHRLDGVWQEVQPKPGDQ